MHYLFTECGRANSQIIIISPEGQSRFSVQIEDNDRAVVIEAQPFRGKPILVDRACSPVQWPKATHEKEAQTYESRILPPPPTPKRPIGPDDQLAQFLRSQRFAADIGGHPSFRHN